MSRTALDRARYSITTHNPRKGPKPEGGPLELQTRRILEQLQRELDSTTLESQERRWDFHWCGIPVDIQDEKSHAKETQRKHDAYKFAVAVQEREREGAFPVYIIERWLKDRPDAVSVLMWVYAILQGATPKEAA